MKTVFMFCGQGSQHFQMGKELFETDEVFRQSMHRLDRLAREIAGRSVIEAIYSGTKADTFDRTLLTHPAIFMVEYSLAQRLLNAGVVPDMTLGVSLGSFAAATVAGYISVEDAMAAVMQQAVTFESCCSGGGMIAVLANPALFAEPFLSAHSELAGVNFASHFVVAAKQATLGEIEAGLRQRNITHQRLPVSFAFHSRWMDEARASLQASMRAVRWTRGRLPLVCCALGQALWELPDDFFWRVVRQPIRFRDAIARLEQDGPFRYIDAGPGGTLATFVKYAQPATSRSTAHAILTPFGTDQKNLQALLALIPQR